MCAGHGEARILWNSTNTRLTIAAVTATAAPPSFCTAFSNPPPHDCEIPASHRWMPNRLRNARSTKYWCQRGSNGLAVPLICGCRRILVLVALRNRNQTIWPFDVRSPVSTANTQLRWPMVCQYLRMTHWLDFFGCRRLAQRQRLCHNT